MAEARAGKRFWIGMVAAVLMLAVAGTMAILERRADYRALAQETEARAVPIVAVIHPTLEDADEALVLPSTLQAYVESPIYARTSGYLKKWYFDIGSDVKAGALLADIDTPEVDQELAQARAARQQTEANLALAKSSAERWEALRKTDSVSQQELDEKKSAYQQLQATLAAADANVHRLEELEAFKHINAPFAGVVTRRNVDVGMLVTAGTSGSQLFYLAQTDPMRVYVSVPEVNAPAVRAGLAADIELTSYPGERFSGKVVRTSGSIDPATRTLLTEVDVPNAQHRLLPGGYAQVHLKIPGVGARLQVPVNALLFRAEGLRAAVVDNQNRVHLRALTIGRDFGSSLEVLQGLSRDDWIVLNPADSLEENEPVQVERSSGSAPDGARVP